jgi:hypothetical protein
MLSRKSIIILLFRSFCITAGIYSNLENQIAVFSFSQISNSLYEILVIRRLEKKSAQSADKDFHNENCCSQFMPLLRGYV